MESPPVAIGSELQLLAINTQIRHLNDFLTSQVGKNIRAIFIKDKRTLLDNLIKKVSDLAEAEIQKQEAAPSAGAAESNIQTLKAKLLAFRASLDLESDSAETETPEADRKINPVFSASKLEAFQAITTLIRTIYLKTFPIPESSEVREEEEIEAYDADPDIIFTVVHQAESAEIIVNQFPHTFQTLCSLHQAIRSGAYGHSLKSKLHAGELSFFTTTRLLFLESVRNASNLAKLDCFYLQDLDDKESADALLKELSQACQDKNMKEVQNCLFSNHCPANLRHVLDMLNRLNELVCIQEHQGGILVLFQALNDPDKLSQLIHVGMRAKLCCWIHLPRTAYQLIDDASHVPTQFEAVEMVVPELLAKNWWTEAKRALEIIFDTEKNVEVVIRLAKGQLYCSFQHVKNLIGLITASGSEVNEAKRLVYRDLELAFCYLYAAGLDGSAFETLRRELSEMYRQFLFISRDTNEQVAGYLKLIRVTCLESFEEAQHDAHTLLCHVLKEDADLQRKAYGEIIDIFSSYPLEDLLKFVDRMRQAAVPTLFIYNNLIKCVRSAENRNQLIRWLEHRTRALIPECIENLDAEHLHEVRVGLQLIRDGASELHETDRLLNHNVYAWYQHKPELVLQALHQLSATPFKEKVIRALIHKCLVHGLCTKSLVLAVRNPALLARLLASYFAHMPPATKPVESFSAEAIQVIFNRLKYVPSSNQSSLCYMDVYLCFLEQACKLPAVSPELMGFVEEILEQLQFAKDPTLLSALIAFAERLAIAVPTTTSERIFELFLLKNLSICSLDLARGVASMIHDESRQRKYMQMIRDQHPSKSESAFTVRPQQVLGTFHQILERASLLVDSIVDRGAVEYALLLVQQLIREGHLSLVLYLIHQVNRASPASALRFVSAIPSLYRTRAVRALLDSHLALGQYTEGYDLINYHYTGEEAAMVLIEFIEALPKKHPLDDVRMIRQLLQTRFDIQETYESLCWRVLTRYYSHSSRGLILEALHTIDFAQAIWVMKFMIIKGAIFKKVTLHHFVVAFIQNAIKRINCTEGGEQRDLLRMLYTHVIYPWEQSYADCPLREAINAVASEEVLQQYRHLTED